MFYIHFLMYSLMNFLHDFCAESWNPNQQSIPCVISNKKFLSFFLQQWFHFFKGRRFQNKQLQIYLISHPVVKDFMLHHKLHIYIYVYPTCLPIFLLFFLFPLERVVMFLFHWNGLSKFFKHGILDVQIINRLYSLHYCTSLETSSHI